MRKCELGHLIKIGLLTVLLVGLPLAAIFFFVSLPWVYSNSSLWWVDAIFAAIAIIGTFLVGVEIGCKKGMNE